MTFVDKSDTGGKISAQLSNAPPGFNNPPHVHTREDEVFYVISGEIQIRIADRLQHLTQATSHSLQLDSHIKSLS